MHGLNSQQRADIVIIGNGIAGLTAAVEARILAPQKGVVIVTEQCHPTINTPALKQFAMGRMKREHLLAYPQGMEQAREIGMINERVEYISACNQYIVLADGKKIGYDSLLLATGSIPTGMPAQLAYQQSDGVLILHRLQHYIDLRRRLKEVRHVVVIGGGVHAAETVMALLQLGISTHWLIRSKTCIPRILDVAASDLLLQHVRRSGAKVSTETEIVRIENHIGVLTGVETNTGQMIPCQLLLVCTGTTPLTALAEQCDLPLWHERKRGILVDQQLRTSVPNIYAAGDVAALENPFTGSYETRAQWYAARVQGCMAAAMMTGGHENCMQSSGVPWHATRIGAFSLLTVGQAPNYAQSGTLHTFSHKGSYCRLSLVENRLVSYLFIGPKQIDGLAIKQLVDQQLEVGPLKEGLLKGTFDARKYFLARHWYIVPGSRQDAGTSPALPISPQPAAGSLSFADGISPRHTDALPLFQENYAGKRASHTEPLPGLVTSEVFLPSERRTASPRSLWSYDRKRGQFLVEESKRS